MNTTRPPSGPDHTRCMVHSESQKLRPPERTDDPVWGNRFHWCVLAAAFLASAEGRLGDSRYVQKLAYEMYETGAFRDRIVTRASEASSTSDDPSIPEE